MILQYNKNASLKMRFLFVPLKVNPQNYVLNALNYL